MFENIDEKYNSVTKIFEILVNNKDFAVPNSIILHGPDVIGQYYFALLLARGANCIGSKKQDCSCQNCRWIKYNEHPEVLTISKIDSKPEGDDSKSVISVKQIDMIKDKLFISSDYHRFFIFCDAEIRELSVDEKEKMNNFSFLNQSLQKYEKDNWVPLGLTKNCFSDIVANALLKSVEEPPANVTFIFLTENIENIISTIVSRSQAYYIPGNSKKNYSYEFLTEILKNYPNIDRKKAVKISEFLLDYSRKNNKPLSEIIASIQIYLKDLIRQNPKNHILMQLIYQDISELQKIMTMLNTSFKEQTAADEAGYVLTK